MCAMLILRSIGLGRVKFTEIDSGSRVFSASPGNGLIPPACPIVPRFGSREALSPTSATMENQITKVIHWKYSVLPATETPVRLELCTRQCNTRFTHAAQADSEPRQATLAAVVNIGSAVLRRGPRQVLGWRQTRHTMAGNKLDILVPCLRFALATLIAMSFVLFTYGTWVYLANFWGEA